jgi:hypothetical protein
MRLAACAWLISAAQGTWSRASEPAALDAAYRPLLEPANWQEPAVEPLPPESVLPIPPQPGETYVPRTPLLDSGPTAEELVPPAGLADDDITTRRGVRPYGGGHPGDWPWGCNGSPFRNGPGWCDTWKVGCRWDVAVDGIVLLREDADLAALAAATNADSAGMAIDTPGSMLDDPMLEQFDYGPGGRVTFVSKIPDCGWQMHFAYEGIEEWNASVVYPKQPLVAPPLPPDFPSEQRSLHYRSSLHSAELTFVRTCSPVWRPYCGVRYVKFDDEINDFINQEAAPPLPGNPPPPPNPVITTDSLNLFDLENNLIGFQIGVRHDLWRPSRRLAVEGFVNTGVYYNHIRYTNLMGQFTTQVFADNTSTTNVDESRTDFSDVTNNDVSELSEISYITEASVSGVCRLNKCWALRAGYQALWINNVHLAEDAFLGTDLEGRSLFFHGWHAGVEHRR